MSNVEGKKSNLYFTAATMFDDHRIFHYWRLVFHQNYLRIKEMENWLMNPQKNDFLSTTYLLEYKFCYRLDVPSSLVIYRSLSRCKHLYGRKSPDSIFLWWRWRYSKILEHSIEGFLCGTHGFLIPITVYYTRYISLHQQKMQGINKMEKHLWRLYTVKGIAPRL